VKQQFLEAMAIDAELAAKFDIGWIEKGFAILGCYLIVFAKREIKIFTGSGPKNHEH